jgi:hypothetical protein
MLRRVAYAMQYSDNGLAGNFIDREDLQACLTTYLKTQKEAQSAPSIATIIIDQLRERNFILCFLGGDSYGFVHRTFLEYFCASEIVYQFEKQQTLSFEELRDQVFGQHWQDETWHEVLQLICGLIDEGFAEKIVNHLIEQDNNQDKIFIPKLFLIAECFAEIKSHKSIRNENIDQLLYYLKILSNHKRFEIEQFDCDEGEIVRTISSEASDICTRALLTVARIWRGNDDVRLWLLNVAKSDNWVVRSEAVLALAENFKAHSQTLDTLRDLIQLNYEDIRKAALKALLTHYPTHPKTLELLGDRALHDPDEQLREWAQEQLKIHGTKVKMEVSSNG